METKNVDRRILRTKQALRDALISLLNEKDLSVISITDIVNRSDLNRSTFYAHFKDKEDLLACLIEDLTKGIINSIEDLSYDTPTKINEKTFLLHAATTIFSYIEKHSLYFKTLLNNRRTRFIPLLSEDLYHFFLKRIEHQEIDDEQPIHSGFFACYLSSTLVGFICHWLFSPDSEHDSNDIANELTKIMMLKPYIPHLTPANIL
ncbi:TetR/AcrR family transcriptional regulator [Sporosarcina sp. FSL K6-1522]|uniref:TetR/AcrR family transcriptional regulator n=1 Tax=Sporosarcina sp. FSL K6-1522 TaxID=2921554 RepID=UPI00315ADDA9